jgi:hypothetical protein
VNAASRAAGAPVGPSTGTPGPAASEAQAARAVNEAKAAARMSFDMGGSSLDGIAGRPAPETGEKMRRSALARFLPEANILLVRASGVQAVVRNRCRPPRRQSDRPRPRPADTKIALTEAA